MQLKHYLAAVVATATILAGTVTGAAMPAPTPPGGCPKPPAHWYESDYHGYRNFD
ncbi:hypothetical protein SISNIDRAFT_483184 [Sistotremastrum niveocremeum HHB9708]|uniref:Uncharacterized protein n=2 Tax=Sistotremastraceae TaxID=3402574 RepID=A0A164X9A9_9AGAM|nr:hypothetical protein SISNIDRAFT_483184 [Sistotremastrum niveocremeum HHB9708]KZT32799.1 hypothetical protein SISSUDRAFT_1066655 [Sistotremastrum suecicum HHB10207 ss-3]